MKRLSLFTLIAAGLFPSQAFAWKHVEFPFAWLPEDMPIQYHIDDECEESLDDPTYCKTMIDESFDSWRNVPCISYDFEYGGVYDGILGVKRTIALVQKPDYVSLYQQLGIDTAVSPRPRARTAAWSSPAARRCCTHRTMWSCSRSTRSSTACSSWRASSASDVSAGRRRCRPAAGRSRPRPARAS